MSWGSVAVARQVGNYEKKSLKHSFCAELELHLEKLHKMMEHVTFLVDHNLCTWLLPSAVSKHVARVSNFLVNEV